MGFIVECKKIFTLSLRTQLAFSCLVIVACAWLCLGLVVFVPFYKAHTGDGIMVSHQDWSVVFCATPIVTALCLQLFLFVFAWYYFCVRRGDGPALPPSSRGRGFPPRHTPRATPVSRRLQRSISFGVADHNVEQYDDLTIRQRQHFAVTWNKRAILLCWVCTVMSALGFIGVAMSAVEIGKYLTSGEGLDLGAGAQSIIAVHGVSLLCWVLNLFTLGAREYNPFLRWDAAVFTSMGALQREISMASLDDDLDLGINSRPQSRNRVHERRDKWKRFDPSQQQNEQDMKRSGTSSSTASPMAPLRSSNRQASYESTEVDDIVTENTAQHDPNGTSRVMTRGMSENALSISSIDGDDRDGNDRSHPSSLNRRDSFQDLEPANGQQPQDRRSDSGEGDLEPLELEMDPNDDLVPRIPSVLHELSNESWLDNDPHEVPRLAADQRRYKWGSATGQHELEPSASSENIASQTIRGYREGAGHVEDKRARERIMSMIFLSCNVLFVTCLLVAICFYLFQLIYVCSSISISDLKTRPDLTVQLYSASISGPRSLASAVLNVPFASGSLPTEIVFVGTLGHSVYASYHNTTTTKQPIQGATSVTLINKLVTPNGVAFHTTAQVLFGTCS
jgi:hypothetical protein